MIGGKSLVGLSLTEMRDGMAIAPDRPGHGIEFDWDALKHFKIN